MVSKLHCLQIAKTLFKKRQIRRGYFGGKNISKQIQNRDLVTLPAVWRYIIRTSRRRGRSCCSRTKRAWSSKATTTLIKFCSCAKCGAIFQVSSLQFSLERLWKQPNSQKPSRVPCTAGVCLQFFWKPLEFFSVNLKNSSNKETGKTNGFFCKWYFSPSSVQCNSGKKNFFFGFVFNLDI